MCLAALLVGCGARSALTVDFDAARPDAGPAPMDAGGDAGVDAGTDAGAPDAGPLDAGYVPPREGCSEIRRGVMPPSEVPQVDLLFVVDDSGSMATEQDMLADGFPRFARAIVTGDLDGDGAIDFPPVTDLQVGVVSTDMGWIDRVDGELVPTDCAFLSGMPGGLDGLLRPPNLSVDGCAEQPDETIVSYAEGDSIEAFADAFSCHARLGIDGCGFEQPLEAALKALTPSTSPIHFLGGLDGHGDGANAGFLRPGSLLAVIVLTDEDDRSVMDDSFRETTTEEESVLGDAWLHPVRRYVDGLLALRADPSLVVFAAIAGLPLDLAGPVDSRADADAILADPRMQNVYSPRSRVNLAPACNSDINGSATPARRLVELAGELAGRSVVESICQDDFRPAIGVIAARLGALVETTWCVDGTGP